MVDTLYRLDMHCDLVEVPVERETEKTYVVPRCRGSFNRRIINKGDLDFDERASMALVYGRDVLKVRVLRAMKALEEAEWRFGDAKNALVLFDKRYGVESASGEARIDMVDYRVENANGIVFITEK